MNWFRAALERSRLRDTCDHEWGPVVDEEPLGGQYVRCEKCERQVLTLDYV